MLNNRSISNEQVIRLAACHECCAMRGEQCTFTRQEDPHLLRTVAKKSHDSLVIRAKKIAAKELPQQKIEFEDIII